MLDNLRYTLPRLTQHRLELSLYLAKDLQSIRRQTVLLLFLLWDDTFRS